MKKSIVLITGGSSGIGYYLAKELFKKGFMVYEFSRRDLKDSSFIHMTVDITDEDRVIEAVEEIMEKEGKIDILINNAGFGISGAIEMTDKKEAHRQLEVNLFGMDNVTRAVLPHMRKAGKGRIICVSSMAALVSIPFQAWYSISKACVNSYVYALRNEVRPYGIRVCAVMPGDICTGFTAAREKNLSGDDIYGGRIMRSVATMERDEEKGMKAEDAAKRIAAIALQKRPKPYYVIGGVYKGLTVLIKLLPASLANYIVMLLYAR